MLRSVDTIENRMHYYVHASAHNGAYNFSICLHAVTH